MAEASTQTTWDGMFKRVYADAYKNFMPEDMYFQKNWKFKAEKKLGDSYEQPVAISLEHGFTAGGEAGNMYALENAISSESGNARVKGTSITLTSKISKDAVERSSNSEAAFIRGTKFKVEMMQKAHSKLLEELAMYGRAATGRGIITSISGTGTTRALTILRQEWAPGLWFGMKNLTMDAYVSTTKQNTLAALVVTSVNATPASTSVGGVVNISGNATDLTALDSAVSGNDTYLVRRGFYGNDFLGLDNIVATQSGNLFNLSTDNELWKASTYDVGTSITSGADLTMEHALNAGDQVWERGGEGELDLICSNRSFTKLALDEAALKRYGAERKAINGFETLQFLGNGTRINIVPHRFIKWGDAFMFPRAAMSWIGTYEGAKFETAYGSQVFWVVAGYSGYEMRSYSDCAIFPEAPAHIVKLRYLNA